MYTEQFCARQRHYQNSSKRVSLPLHFNPPEGGAHVWGSGGP